MVFAGVPALNGVFVLYAWVSTDVRSLRNFIEQVVCTDFGYDFARFDGAYLVLWKVAAPPFPP